MSAVLRSRSPLALISLLAILVATLVSTAPDATAATRTQRILAARSVALNQLGDPYRYGAAGPDRFDCSGLIYFSTHRAGFDNVPRTASAQSQFMRRIPKSNMRAGDFMFFYDGGGVYHVAMFVGRNNGHRVLVHSPSTGSHVQRARPWTSRWFAGTLR